MPPRIGARGNRVDALRVVGGLDVAGDCTFGDGVEPSRVAFNGSFRLPTVDDVGMVATDGEVGDVVFNLADLTAYTCTTAGSPGVWAAANLALALVITGDLSATGTHTVTGDVTLGGILGVTGDLTVTGSAEIGGDLQVDGVAAFNGDLTLAGAVTGFHPRAVADDPADATPGDRPVPVGLYDHIIYSVDHSLWYCTDATAGAPVWVKLSP